MNAKTSRRRGSISTSVAKVPGVGSGERRASRTQVKIDAHSVSLTGDLTIPDRARSVVIFAHGSGSSRLSPRNRYVAEVLQEAGLGTLLFDLLTQEEDLTYGNRFDIDLLSDRLSSATDWLMTRTKIDGVRLAYFGASTGAAAALRASIGRYEVSAIVSRGGRPDLAWDCLDMVEAPTLLIVGGLDAEVIELNKLAFERLKADAELAIVPGATHLFEETGALEEVARLAKGWFLRFLRTPGDGLGNKKGWADRPGRCGPAAGADSVTTTGNRVLPQA